MLGREGASLGGRGEGSNSDLACSKQAAYELGAQRPTARRPLAPTHNMARPLRRGERLDGCDAHRAHFPPALAILPGMPTSHPPDPTRPAEPPSGRLRICLVTGEYPPDEGGVADYTRCLAEALVDMGVHVDVVTSCRDRSNSEGGNSTERARDALPETDVAATPGSDSAENDDRIAIHRIVPSWGWSVLPLLRRFVSAARSDVVHVQYQSAAYGMRPAANAIPWWLGRRTAVLTAGTYHDLLVPYLFPKAGRVRSWVTRLPARTADLILTTNADDHARVAKWPVRGRHALVPIGSNVPDAPPAGYDHAAWRAAHSIPPEARLLAYFGFLNQSKGGRVLLDALGRLRAEGRDARLVMIGGRVGASDPTNAAYLADFEADAAARGLAGALSWTGHVPPAEVSAWLRAADVAVLPYADGASYRRGSLMAALEHGAPIVTTRPAPTGGELPALVDGQSALLVAAGDGEALARAVGAVVDDKGLAARLSSGARAVAAHFGWDAIAARHVGLYREVKTQ